MKRSFVAASVLIGNPSVQLLFAIRATLPALSFNLRWPDARVLIRKYGRKAA